MKIRFETCCEVRLFYKDGVLACSFREVPGSIVDIIIPEDCYIEVVPIYRFI